MARVFDGTGDKLQHTSISVDITNGVTLACWSYHSNTSSARRISSLSPSANTSSFLIQSDANYAYALVSSGASTAYHRASCPSGWFHLAGVFSGASRTVYANGSAGTVSSGSISITEPAVLSLGAVAYNSGLLYGVGSVAHAAVWECVLSSEDISALYSGGIGVDPRTIRPDALVAYYPLIAGTTQTRIWTGGETTT